jgi:RNA polymerase sigma-70 factor (ECF subfamily)
MDDTAIRDTLTALHPASFGWASVCCRGKRDLAEDVLQSVYVRVLDGRARFDGKSLFRTWLFAVIRNTARSQLRRQWWSRVVRLELASLGALFASAGPVERKLDQDQDVAAIRAALGRLPQRQREVMHLVFYEDLTIADAAEAMQVSVGAARQHYARAKEAMKKSLKNLDVGAGDRL